MVTHRARNAEGLGTAAIAVVFFLGTALSGVLALNLQRQQEAEVMRMTMARAQSLSRLGEAELDRLYSDLQRRAALWIELPEPAMAMTRLQVLMEENPSVLALSYPMKRGGRRATRSDAEALMGAWQESDPPFDTILGPERLDDGRLVLGANLRASYSGTLVAPIFAVFEPKALLDPFFAEAAADYAYALELGDTVLWSREADAPPRDLAPFASRVVSKPRLGAPFTIVVWPSAAAMPGSHFGGPILAFTIGVLTSGLIAAALHLGTLAWRRARILDELNLALDRQVDATLRNQRAQQRLSEELESRVDARTAELNDTIAELQTFNYTVSHDLRSPLAAIINFAGIFAEDYAGRLDEVQIGYLDRITSSARAAVDLMDALMSYSQSGRSELRPVRLSARRIVLELAEEAIAASKDSSCAFKIGDLPDVDADETMFRFIFANLISNACKFKKPGENASIEIGGSAEATEHVYFVRDEGIGFDPRFEQKLFKVFERLHRSNTYPGHGIGLAIVARMVRRHGGRVWAQGALGKGSTFYFSIPRRWTDRDDAEES